jgi:hypothetical protein
MTLILKPTEKTLREIELSLEKVLEAGYGKVEIIIVGHEIVDIIETKRKRVNNKASGATE